MGESAHFPFVEMPDTGSQWAHTGLSTRDRYIDMERPMIGLYASIV